MRLLGPGRVLALLLAAIAAAAFLIAPSSASSPPRTGRGSVQRVSSAIPYMAPWQSGFERFSTQVVKPGKVGINWLVATIPDGQWYRIIYLNATFTTGAVVANRSIRAEFSDSQGNVLFQEYVPAVEAASSQMTALFAPGATAFANVGDPLRGQATATLPDVLWPPGTVLTIKVDNPQAGDGWAVVQVFAVEVYTPVKERPGVFVPTPAIA